MHILKYGNTNCFLIPGSKGYLLVDTDYAGLLSGFYKALKEAGVRLSEISFFLATHFHPDHTGLAGNLMKQGITLLLPDVQKEHVQDSDYIFQREGIPYERIPDEPVRNFSCEESRELLREIGISGEILSTPSHSSDSVSLILDEGISLVGDLEPIEYLAAYGEHPDLKKDWERIASLNPKQVFYSHQKARTFGPGELKAILSQGESKI